MSHLLSVLLYYVHLSAHLSVCPAPNSIIANKNDLYNCMTTEILWGVLTLLENVSN
jgi:hypothetical protein